MGVHSVLRLYNTLTRRVEQVRPLEAGLLKMYTCGPTVYRDAHIGNLRSYLMADWIRRALEAQGVRVNHVKNITDVGHMRQEMLERGDDKVVAAAIAEGKTPAEIADFYSQRFFADEERLNILRAAWFPRATDHIREMIEIVERLVEIGYAYEEEGNVYFSVSAFAGYGRLSGNIHEEELAEAVRVEADPLKRDPRDFTLWKAAEPGRELRWNSPWGPGFPGWHIECSAMSIKYLGRRFDIHTGGVDNVFPHHEGEMAQSEGFTGDYVVNHWVHGQHLLADGVKMAKSAGNSFVLSDIESQDIDPLAFRYLCLTARYSNRVNFTFAALKAAQRGLLRLYDRVWEWTNISEGVPEEQDETAAGEWKARFLEHINSDLDLPAALAVTWRMVRSQLPVKLKLRLLSEYDAVLGLGLGDVPTGFQAPEKIRRLNERRTRLRMQGRYEEADAIRDKLDAAGYLVRDVVSGSLVRRKTAWEERQERWPSLSSSSEAPSFVGEDDVVDFTVAIVACNYLHDVRRCVESSLTWLRDRSAEVVIVDNGSTDGTAEWCEQLARTDARVRVVHADHVLGEGAAKSIALKQSRGSTVVLLDTSVEVMGDIFGRIDLALADNSIGVFGPFGLRTPDLLHFHEGEGEAGDMDAMQSYCFAFRRRRLEDVGLMRESFRFYRNLDLDYSFHFKDKGYRVVADPTLPVVRHEHRVWSALPEGERDTMSRKNYGRFLDKWAGRTDLLVVNQKREGTTV